ncbi:ubiquinone biosynthesis protein COQ9, mitochondrial precursor [Polyplosphaeria fusca]|uniref:Ubiquinone biosynthesis protein n=1 Tax=Polyplosphaeria fusca TaxID=682080 RepID=A0A9P4R7I5_9PLEO|nr:ubiquinone biosynthesis protein COQ9, mitochondrial precursor [Polyplosphaeria fusca]
MSPLRLPTYHQSALGTLRAAARGPAARRRARFYHSYDHSQPPPFTPAESAILSAAISHVPRHGFTINALKQGARDVGYLDVSTNLLPRGVFDLINYHLVTQRLALKDSVQFAEGQQAGGKTLGVGAKVRALTLARLRANQGVIDCWQEALAIMAQPSYVAASVAELARLADEIWFLAGDTSVDTSWYTKRASLSAIYSATDVFMTQDRSRNFTETEEFLDARLEDSNRIGLFLGGLGEWADYTAHSAVNVLRSKGVRM